MRGVLVRVRLAPFICALALLRGAYWHAVYCDVNFVQMRPYTLTAAQLSLTYENACVRISADAYMPTATRTPLQSISNLSSVISWITYYYYHCILAPSSMHFVSYRNYACVIQELCTSIQHRHIKKTPGDIKTAIFYEFCSYENFVAMKIKIEIEIEIASFCQDCRKYQDCLLLGNLLK